MLKELLVICAVNIQFLWSWPHPESFNEITDDFVNTHDWTIYERESLITAQLFAEVKNSRAETISNLQEIINPFVLQRCLVVLTSWKTVEMQRLTFPVILRNMKPVAVLNASENTNLQVIWFPQHNNGNKTNMRRCTSHNFFYVSFPAEFETFPSYCTEFDIPVFSAASRPWQCDLDIHLFLPNYKFGSEARFELEYPYAFDYRKRAPLIAKSYMFINDFTVEERSLYESICEKLE